MHLYSVIAMTIKQFIYRASLHRVAEGFFTSIESFAMYVFYSRVSDFSLKPYRQMKVKIFLKKSRFGKIYCNLII